MAIDWRPYDDDTFAEARARGVPILLVVTNRFTHACHRLDVETLDDPALEAALAAWIAIRVDCDARPDVDAVAQAWIGRAEAPVWPVIAVLDADARPRLASAHLPRAELQALVASRAATLPAFSPAPAPDAPASAAAATSDEAGLAAHVDQALERVRLAFDPRFGGFGPPPRHPRPALLDLLLDLEAPWARTAALRTLDALAQGGVHDQLAGGFHRLSTDERWVVPHFEKRAGDQAALLATFARAAAITGIERYAEVARAIFAWVEGALARPAGGYAAAQSADAGAYDDASYYTWSLAEARAALDADELAVAQPTWDLYGRGELVGDPTRNVLFVATAPADVARELGRPLAELLPLVARARAALARARAARPAPPIDARRYSGVAARLVRAYLEADRALAWPEARTRALATLTTLYAARDGDGGIAHDLDGNGGLRWLADHAEFGLAAVRAYAATGDGVHREAARAVAAVLAARFAHPDGGFVATPGGRLRPLVDDGEYAGPSANAVAGRLFAELAEIDAGDAGDAARRCQSAARALVAACLPLACRHGAAAAGLICLHRHLQNRQ